MKIHLVPLQQSAYDAMLALCRRAEPELHTLVDDPESADMILCVGNWPGRGEGVVDNPLVKKYPEKTFVYNDDDGFVPLLPGVYTNAEKSSFFDLHRVESQNWIQVLNPFTEPMQVEKKYLFSFAGGSTCLLRKRLYKVKFGRPDVLVENTSAYFHWDPTQPDREARQKRYAEIIASSHFGLVPRGASAGCLRLVETMQMGVAPVVVADKWLLPYGPEWESIAVQVPERRIAELDSILEKHVGESAERGRRARQAYEEWFAPSQVFNRVVESCARTRARRRIPERWIRPFWGFMLWRVRCFKALRGFARRLILGVFRLMGKSFVYEMNTR